MVMCVIGQLNVEQNHNISIGKLHGYTVHQQYPALYFPTNGHNVKKRRVIETFLNKEAAPTCFGL